MKHLIVATAQGIKSIPLSQFPAEAWLNLFGGDEGSVADTVMSRYESVPWLYQGVNAIANAIADLPHCFQILSEVDDKGNVVEDENYEPPFELEFDHFINELSGDQTLFGASYIWLDASAPLRLRQIRRLYPGSIRPKYDQDAGLVGFRRRVGSEERFFATDDIAHIWLPNRKKELGPGAPPGQAALRVAGVLVYLDMFVEKFFEQGTIAPVIIGVEDSTSEADLERVQSWFQRRLTGIRNAFGAIAIRGGINPHVLAQNELDKLAMEPLSNQKREDIATALGVPHSLLFSNAANYATAQQDMFNFYELTVNPQARRIEQALNKRVFQDLGVKLKFQPEKLEMYQAREAEKSEKLLGYYRERVITKNELRVQAGFDPVEGGDEFEEKPQPPPQFNQPPQNDESEPEEASEEYEDKAFHADLRRWRQKALNRLKASKSLAFSFESAAIEPSLAAAIEGALEACKSAQDVRRVFDDAMRFTLEAH